MAFKTGAVSKPHKARVRSSITDVISKIRDAELLCCDLPVATGNVLLILEQAEDAMIDVYLSATK